MPTARIFFFNVFMLVLIVKTKHEGWGIGVDGDDAVAIGSVRNCTPIPSASFNSVCNFNAKILHKCP